MLSRMRWAAEYAVNRFDVTLLGLVQEGVRSTEERDGYRIVRLPRKPARARYYLWRFLQAAPLRTQLILVLKLSFLLPLVAMIDLGRRMADCISQPSRTPSWMAASLLWAMEAPSPRRWAILGPAILVLVPLAILLEIYLRMVDLAFQLARRTALSRTDSPELKAWLDELRSIHWKMLPQILDVVASLRDQLAPTMYVLDEIDGMPCKPSTIHCRGLAALLVGVLTKKRYGGRVVYDIDEFCQVGEDGRTCIETALWNCIEAVLIRQADAIVTESATLSALVARRYGLSSVHTVPNAAPWIAPTSRTAPVSDMSHLAAGRVIFLFQGQFTPDPGIPELICGWVHTNPEKCALFLRGTDNIWRQRAMEQAAALGMLGRNIYFLPAVADADLIRASAEAAVGLIPYYPQNPRNRFACPDEISQYLQAGLAILANDQPNMRSVIEDAQAGMFYSSFDLTTLAQSVEQLLADPEAIPRLRRNAHAYAESVFNWQRISSILYGQYVPAEA